MQDSEDVSRPLRRDDSVVVEMVDDELCLYRRGSTEVALLNRTAAEIWELVDGVQTADEIAVLLARSYEQDVYAVSIEVRGVLTDLLDRGFVVRA